LSSILLGYHAERYVLALTADDPRTPDIIRRMRARLHKLSSARTERTYEAPPEEVLKAAAAAVKEMPRWELEESRPGELRATRRTRVFRFVDDVRVEVRGESGGSRVELESESRVGTWDLGQNGRNLRELIRRLDRKLG
jgi:uncharacterized protein (DUF1499 family)